jgi:hypothetical protein
VTGQAVRSVSQQSEKFRFQQSENFRSTTRNSHGSSDESIPRSHRARERRALVFGSRGRVALLSGSWRWPQQRARKRQTGTSHFAEKPEVLTLR